MASSTFEWFDEASKIHMRNSYLTLSEKDQRHYEAVEAKRLGRGGIEYVANFLDCATKSSAEESKNLIPWLMIRPQAVCGASGASRKKHRPWLGGRTAILSPRKPRV
ncbi:MAG: hypothetical protein IT427_04030 [Pirellulales bacterium]|nr:hypothetical protein [Pirellulales bacterium]